MSPRTAGTVALAGVLGWVGLVWLAIQLYGTHPPTAGFDLESCYPIASPCLPNMAMRVQLRA